MSDTTNYHWTKPTDGDDIDTWGDMLNAIFDGVDAQLFAVSGVASSAMPLAGGTFGGGFGISGTSLSFGAPTSSSVSGLFGDTTGLVLRMPSGGSLKLQSASGAATWLEVDGSGAAFGVPVNATTASAWQTARSLSFTGDATGSMTLDGSANASAALTLASVNSNTGAFGSSTTVPVLTVNAKGLVTAASSAAILPGVPPGAVMAFAMTTPPSGWLECDGSSQSTTGATAALFTAIGYAFGGSGSSFNLPDLRGQFVRGWAHSGSTDSGRGFASLQQDAFQGHFMGALTGGNTFYTLGSGGRGGSASGSGGAQDASTGGPVGDGTNGAPRTAGETRPVNVALMYCIRT